MTQKSVECCCFVPKVGRVAPRAPAPRWERQSASWGVEYSTRPLLVWQMGGDTIKMFYERVNWVIEEQQMLVAM